MAFSFGSGTSGQQSGGLFSTSNATNSKSLFGSAGGNSGFSFGQPSTSTPATGENKPAGLFGQTTDNKTGGGLFGATPTAGGGGGGGGGGGLFGNPNPTPASSQPPGTPSQSAAPKSLFGSTTPAPSAGGNIFGNPSTTPAGQPPTTSLFGASTGASQPASSAPTFAFAKPGAPASAAAPDPSATPLFGQVKSDNSSNLFGQKPATTQPSSTGNLFGQAATAAPSATTSSVFGNPADAQPKPAAGGWSFGQASKSDKPAESAPSAASTASKPFSFPVAAASGQPSNPPSSAPQPATSLFTPAAQSSQPASTSSPAPAQGLFGKPAEPSSQPTKPLFSLGGAATTATSQSPAPAVEKPAFSFGNQASTSSAASPAPATTTAAPASTFKLGATPATNTTTNILSTATPNAAAPSTAAPASGGLFSAKTATTAPAPAPAAGGPFAASTAPATSTTTTANPTFATTSAQQQPGQSNLSASMAGPVPPHQSRLRNKTMDEILTRWASDLTRYTKEFKNHAETIAHWDQIIVDNSMKIDKLYVKTRTCEKQTMSVEMQLSAVENQQNELEAWLNKYESDVDDILSKDGPAQNELGGPDQERERTYKLAEKLGERLDDMGRDLQSMIEEVNAANASLGKGNNSDEPVSLVADVIAPKTNICTGYTNCQDPQFSSQSIISH